MPPPITGWSGRTFTGRPILAIITGAVDGSQRHRWAGLLPELQLFDDASEADAALRQGTKAVFRNPWRWLAVLGLAIAAGVAAGLLSLLLEKALGANSSWGRALGSTVSGAAALLAVEYLLRQPVQHSLRVQLIERGITVCMDCGCDLRRVEDGRCPECDESASGDSA